MLRKGLLAAAGNQGGPWDISGASFDGGTQSGILSVSSQDIFPVSLFFKPDGTKMYVVGANNDSIYEYDLTTAWDVSTGSYLQSFSVISQAGLPVDIYFKDDGTKMYVLDLTTTSVYEYDLSTAWDVSTASYVQNFDVSGQELGPYGLSFKSDGTKMYILGFYVDNVIEYDLSTAWDVSSASYLRAFSVASQTGQPRSLFFKPDGTKMYVVDQVQGFHEYTLSTAWNVSTASFTTSLANDPLQYVDNDMRSAFFKPDGTEVYMVGYELDKVYAFNLSTAWNISTMTRPLVFSNNYINFFPTFRNPRSLFFKPDGTKMYICNSSDDAIDEYDLSTAWDITTQSYLQTKDVSAEESNPFGLFFKPDGTKMYVCGATGDEVNEYSLSTAWDISSASYVRLFSVSTEDTAPVSVFFKPDGTKMYITGNSGDDVNEYNLSTAWNISTASYVQVFSVRSQDTGPSQTYFREDGLKMYIAGSSSILEYDLGTAWNISTASYLQNWSLIGNIPSNTLTTYAPNGIFFHPDGNKMYITINGVFGETISVDI